MIILGFAETASRYIYNAVTKPVILCVHANIVRFNPRFQALNQISSLEDKNTMVNLVTLVTCSIHFEHSGYPYPLDMAERCGH